MHPLVLIVTNQSDSHADYLINLFWERGVQFVRINTDDVPRHAGLTFNETEDSSGWSLYVDGKSTPAESISRAWFRRPLSCVGHPDITEQEAKRFAADECNALMEGLYEIIPLEKWLNAPRHIRISQHKVAQIAHLQRLGVRIPKTLITSDPAKLMHFWDECDGKVIYKTIGRNSTRHPDGRLQFAYANRLTQEMLSDHSAIELAPCLFQEYIEKDVELRVTVVGEEFFTCEIHSQVSEYKTDWRHYEEEVPYVKGQLPNHVERECLRIMDNMNLRFGALDIIRTPNNEYVFLEINPNGQWLWIEQRTKMPISEAIFRFLTSN